MNNTLQYKIEDLKEAHNGKLIDENDLTLIPLLHYTFNLWIEEIKKSSMVSDVKGDWWKGYDFVVDGKIVTLSPSTRDIDVQDEDERWPMIDRLYFKGDANSTVQLYSHFENFVANEYDLDFLIEGAREELRKGKTDHLSLDMGRFYF